MKKGSFILFHLMVGLLVFGLTSCPLSQTPNTPSQNPPPPQSSGLTRSEKIPELKGDIVTTTSGLKYEDVKVGTGAQPQKGQKVSVHYTGRLANGTKFDSSKDRGQPFEFTIGIGQVIKGWDEGVASMKVGGVRNLIIPPELGYGAKGIGATIPPNAELHFNVELLDVK